MEENKQDLINQIQEILDYISLLKEDQDSLNKEYKSISNNYTPIVYKKPTLLDKIFPKTYRSFLRDYAHSQKTNKELEELNHNILLIQMQIEELEIVLYKLQSELSKLNSIDDNTDNDLNKNIKTHEKD